MRKLIEVTEEEKNDLREWAREQPLLRVKIEATIRFRAQVLRAFDRLVASEPKSLTLSQLGGAYPCL